MALEDLMKEVSSELERLVSTKTVVGEAMIVGETTIIPVTKVSFGFGTGGGEGKKTGEEEGFGGGGGAGAKIEPVAFIVISAEGTKLMTMSGQTDFGKILESVPGLIEKVKSMKKSKKDDSCEGDGPCEGSEESSED
ncbi:spore germination protein GerW family protein [Methanolobus sediminis]|uniref:Spore germination protein GerW family protein n=1 Tax=Methanolobus sediminis TaxID=3072978 RepID=A0AA51UIW7_9EURY|nr:spore germination protein GerW family protein [Methanolobus sediminis]WMW23958.1 spore germination protein GerW family protein [Methanolobus sediminis]